MTTVRAQRCRRHRLSRQPSRTHAPAVAAAWSSSRPSSAVARRAERVYREDLGLTAGVQRCAQHPEDVWALHGLVECLRRRGERDERRVLEAKLAPAQARADVPITSSCRCRTSPPSAACCH